uniref:Cytochrome P450 n=1 Tax=Lactuca sativa TaxID=4236 RepID=A0A9R1W1F5_LACSA|nr:hypothetical protein LSAT_V11C400203810 [Lactuca sativa]
MNGHGVIFVYNIIKLSVSSLSKYNLDMEFYLRLLTMVAAIFFAVVLTFLLKIWKGKRGNKGKNNKPPQAKGQWPVIGHLHLLGGSAPPYKVFGDMADKYGPILTINLGVHQALVVSYGEIAKECLTRNDKVFAGRPKSMAAELMAYNYAMFGVAAYGDYWRQVRKIVMLEILSQSRVEMLGHVRASELRASMKDLYEAWVTNKESESLDMVKVDMQQWFGNLILNLIRFSLMDEEGVRFQNVTKKLFGLLGVFVVSDFLPYLKRFNFGGYEKEMRKTAKEMDDIFEGWLDEHKREKESVQHEEGNQVFIDNILTAALDTTSVTLTWALSLLLNNLRELKIAQDEIDEHVGRKRLVEESDMKNLVYLDAIIKETLRLYPAGPLWFPHESMEDFIVGGYNIPKGTRLVLNLWKMHHNPNIWPDPYEFQPQRFLTTHKDIDVKGKHFELLPFGGGRRMCPGYHFALQALRLTLATLIQQFVISKPSNGPIDMSECFGLTISKATPLEVLLAPRLSLDMFPVGA